MTCKCGQEFCYVCGGTTCPHGSCAHPPKGGEVAPIRRPMPRPIPPPVHKPKPKPLGKKRWFMIVFGRLILILSHVKPKKWLKFCGTFWVGKSRASFINFGGFSLLRTSFKFGSSVHIVEGFQYIIYCPLLHFDPFIDSFLQILMHGTNAFLHLGYRRVEFVLVSLFSLFVFGGVKNGTWIEVDFLDLFLEGGDGSFDGGQVKEMFVWAVGVL